MNTGDIRPIVGRLARFEPGMASMAYGDTANARKPGTALMVQAGAINPRPSLTRLPANADFLSQLLAERQRLSTQRARRRAPMGLALEAYAEAGIRGIPRLPAGSYRSRLV